MVNQMEVHIYFQQQELHKALKENNTVLEAWAPFTSGEKDLFHDPVLIEIGNKYHKSAAQIALRYLSQKGIVVIPKSSHRERLIENRDIFDIELNDDELKRIEHLDENRALFKWY